ncbi:MAG TPA: hypothetical protein VK524_32730 [Polyangiaceae bacterium]|nr:hypothetical protein [Polyangiaceae bacterium]
MRIRYAATLMISFTLTFPGCSSDDAPGQLACRQKPDADHDDCEDRTDMRTRKMDCDGDEQINAAMRAGCVRENDDPESNDMCCPTSVSGTPD